MHGPGVSAPSIIWPLFGRAPRSGHRLKGAEVLASWDVDLAPVMREHQMAIAEEGVAASLLQDLERGSVESGS